MADPSFGEQADPLDETYVSRLIGSGASIAYPSSTPSLIIPRYPARSAREEIQHLLVSAGTAPDRIERRDAYKKTIDILSKKIAFLSQLKSKVVEAYYQRKDFYRDPNSGVIYPSSGQTYKDVIQEIDYMFNDNLNLSKKITMDLVDQTLGYHREYSSENPSRAASPSRLSTRSTSSYLYPKPTYISTENFRRELINYINYFDKNSIEVLLRSILIENISSTYLKKLTEIIKEILSSGIVTDPSLYEKLTFWQKRYDEFGEYTKYVEPF